MTYSSNQKRNIGINFGLPKWRFEFTIVISDIKYFLYGVFLLFTSFSVSKFLWRRSYVGGCVMLDVKVVEMFVRYAISVASGIFWGTLTPTEGRIYFNMKFWLHIWMFLWWCFTTKELILWTKVQPFS